MSHRCAQLLHNGFPQAHRILSSKGISMPEHCVLEAWCLRVCVVWLNGNLLGVKAYNFCLALGRPITLAERARTNSWSWAEADLVCRRKFPCEITLTLFLAKTLFQVSLASQGSAHSAICVALWATRMVLWTSASQWFAVGYSKPQSCSIRGTQCT